MASTVETVTTTPQLQLLNTSIIATAAAAVLLLLLLQLLGKKQRKKGEAPEAKGAWPLVGHLHLLNAKSLRHKVLGEISEELGSSFIIRLGLNKALVISSWEVAKECFTTHDAIVSNRPTRRLNAHLTYGGAMFAFSPYGAYWRQLRKISSTELLSANRLDLLKGVRAAETYTSIDQLHATVSTSLKEGRKGAEVDMKQWFGDLTLNITMKVIVGRRYKKGEEEARRCQKALREFFHLPGVYPVGDAFPFLKWLDVGGYEKAMRRNAAEMDVYFEKWLIEHKDDNKSRQQQQVKVGEKGRDFMDVLMSALSKGDDHNLAGHHPDSINKATCLSMVSGGSDTISLVLTWALSLIMNSPSALNRAQAELDEKVGKDRLVDETDIQRLPFLQAITKETLRLHPPGPLSGPRQFTEDCTVNGYAIRKGTWLLLNLYKIQRDPRVWAHPSEFRPERFLAENRDVDVRGTNYELLPFGGGRRACPGISFGLVVVNFTLASLLQAFEISTPGGEVVDMGETVGLTNVKTQPLRVVLAPRLPSHLYH